MKPFIVVWWEYAQSRLAVEWLNALDRAAITSAANEIDRRLAADPTACVEGDHEQLLRFTVSPLSVQFTVDPVNRSVTIWTVRLIKQ
jgi:hypothetical protein